MNKYLPIVAWSSIANKVSSKYIDDIFQINEYSIRVYPLDRNEPGAGNKVCAVGDYFVDFLGWPWRVTEIGDDNGHTLLYLYDVNERSLSEEVNFGPYPNEIGYIYRPLNGKLVLSQAQLLRLDSQARDRINNIEKGVINGGNMNWRGEWTGIDTPYKEGDVVTDLAWTMIANKDTSSRPLPYVSPYELSEYNQEGVDTLFSVDHIFVGNRYLIDEDIIIETIGFRFPLLAHWTYFDFYLVIDPAYSKKITFLDRLYPTDGVKGELNYLNFNELVIPQGVTFDIMAKGGRYGNLEQDDGKDNDDLVYNYMYTNSDPEPGNISHSLNGRTMLVNKKDLNDDDFPLNPITSTISIENIDGNNAVYNILSKTDKTVDILELQVDPVYKADEGAGVDVRVVFLNTYVGGILINYYDFDLIENNRYTGLYSEGNLNDVVETNESYGLGIKYKTIVIDEDWDVVSASSSSINTESGGAGTFPKDSEVDLIADITATKNVGGVSIGDTFTPDDSVRDLLKSIIAPYVLPVFTSFTVYPFQSRQYEVGFYDDVVSLSISSRVDTLGEYPVDCLINPSKTEFPDSFDITQSPQTVNATGVVSRGLSTNGSINWTLTGKGNDNESMSNISFVSYWYWRWFFGANATTITDDASAQTVIDALQQSPLKSGRANSVTCGSYNNDGDKYTYVCYAAKYGYLTNIDQGVLPTLTGFDILGDFNYQNQYGIIEPYRVYRTKATGAYASGVNLIIK